MSRTSVPASAARPADTSAPAASADSVALGAGPSGDTALSPEAAMRAMAHMATINKQDHKYVLGSRCEGADGTVFITYREGWSSSGTSGSPKSGYVSAVRPDGSIRWEALVEDVRGATLDSQQTLHVVSDREHIRLSPDGKELSRSPLEAKPEQFWVEKDGKGLIYLDDKHHLASTDGLPVPAEIKGYVSDFSPAPDGASLLVRTSDGLFRIDGSGLVGTWTTPPTKSEGKVSFNVSRMQALPDGNALAEVTQTIELRPPHGLRGGFGMGFGGGFGPMEPFPGEWITRVSLRKAAPDGTKIWETPNLGERVVAGAAPDGTVYASSDDKVSNGYPVLRVSDDGSTKAIAYTKGLIRKIVPGEQGVSVFYDGGTLRIGPDGTATDHAVPQGWTPVGLARDGRVFVQDGGNGKLGLLDPATGNLTSMTDTEHDYSFQREAEMERIAATLPPPPENLGIVEEDQWIMVGGVRVPKRADTP